MEPSNFYFKPGKRTLEEMMASIGEGLVITEMSGMHAGANPVSGDFSLLSKGYTIENGRKGRAVEQITVAATSIPCSRASARSAMIWSSLDPAMAAPLWMWAK